MQYDVVIVGAGAAGLMCAIEAGKRGKRVCVIEHADRPGKKILISGGGRCNFTNLHATPANYVSSNPHFARSALARYTPWDFISMVERHRIAYHEKEAGQLFCDGSSRLILQMLLDECQAVEVQIELSTSLHQVSRDDVGYMLKTSRGDLSARSLVIATGGLSIPAMGASGVGHALARQFGHRVLPARAALVPVTLSGAELQRYQDLSGVALPVETICGDHCFQAGMLFTHRGLSGPAILQITLYWQPPDTLQINLAPRLDAREWLRAEQDARPAAELRTVLSDIMPRRLALRLCELSFENRPMRQYRAAQLRTIGAQIHAWPIAANGTEGYRTAEVTLGGVDTHELSSATMESRKAPGLYFIGEVVDVTGQLGGFNFQWAWASGFAAGQAVR